MASLIGPVGREITVRDDDAPRLEIAKACARVRQPRENIRVGPRCKRLGVAHQCAQIGVFPFLDAAVRKTRRRKAPECRFAQWRHARELCLRSRPLGRELLLGDVLDEGHFSHFYSAATGASWNWA